jgi:hypothetical protein
VLQPGRILRFPLKPFESNLVAGWIELGTLIAKSRPS